MLAMIFYYSMCLEFDILQSSFMYIYLICSVDLHKTVLVDNVIVIITIDIKTILVNSFESDIRSYPHNICKCI